MEVPIMASWQVYIKLPNKGVELPNKKGELPNKG